MEVHREPTINYRNAENRNKEYSTEYRFTFDMVDTPQPPHSNPPKNPPESKQSMLLSREENEQVFRLLGERCQSMATAVMQLFLTEPPHHSRWFKKDSGVLCLVKDNIRRSYFFRVYCPVRRALLWEQEIYKELDYTAPKPFLITFEAQDCMAAFNFADEGEASIIKSVLYAKKQKRMERRSRLSMQQQQQPHQKIDQGYSNVPNGSLTSISSPDIRSKSGKGKKEKRKLTKADIGLPTEFRHVSHVGWDPNRGFDVENVEDPHYKEFFDRAGVSESQLRDRDTRNFIYDFINRHGGIEAVKKDIHAQPFGAPPPVPARIIQSGAQGRTAPPPPPPPNRTAGVPPPPPSVPPVASAPNLSMAAAAPQLPPSRTLPSLPQARQDYSPANHFTQAPIPPPPPITNAPPPPPPPPTTPPPPTLDNRAPAPPLPPPAVDNRSALMEAIREGKALKQTQTRPNTKCSQHKVQTTGRAEPQLDNMVQHVEPDKKSIGGGDSRGELLDQIRQGVELRSVQPTPKAPAETSDESSLAGALARALADRSRAIHSDSSSSDGEDSEDEDDEWED